MISWIPSRELTYPYGFLQNRATKQYQESGDRTTPPAALHRPEGRPEATFGAVWNQSFRWFMVECRHSILGLLIKESHDHPNTTSCYRYLQFHFCSKLSHFWIYQTTSASLHSRLKTNWDWLCWIIVTSVIISIVMLIIQSTYQLNVTWVNYLQSFTPTRFQISNCPRMS